MNHIGSWLRIVVVEMRPKGSLSVVELLDLCSIQALNASEISHHRYTSCLRIFITIELEFLM